MLQCKPQLPVLMSWSDLTEKTLPNHQNKKRMLLYSNDMVMAFSMKLGRNYSILYDSPTWVLWLANPIRY